MHFHTFNSTLNISNKDTQELALQIYVRFGLQRHYMEDGSHFYAFFNANPEETLLLIIALTFKFT